MNKLIIVLLITLISVNIIACIPPVSGDVIKSEKQRITATNTNSTDLTSLVGDNNGFAIDLYQVLRTKNGNLFMSPYSISEALAMTYAGAQSETMKQMSKALHFYLSGSSFHAAFNNLDQELNNRGKGSKGKDGKGFRLNLVNATWGQKNYSFLPEYLDTLAQYYGAGIRPLDFSGSPEPSRQTINKWVADQTENRIKDLIPQGLINPLTRLVLTNAIYFNAAWQSPFTKESTSIGTFKKLDGQTMNVNMMRQTKSFNYGESADSQIIELPYDGQELSMIVVLPKENRFNEFEQSLTVQKLNSLITNLNQKQVYLFMPKFKLESSFNLKEALSSMGMANAFSESADFSGITGKKDLFIADVVHKTFVVVDEAGTEAAAATAVVMMATSMPPQPLIMTVDKPFIFLIKDNKTGAILFLGRILVPQT